MKNKFLLFQLLILVLILSFNTTKLSADDVLINAKNVDIKDKGNVIEASGSVSITDGLNIQINGKKANYNKEIQKLEIVGDVIFVDKNKNLKIKTNKIIFDRDKDLIYSYKNTEIFFLDKENLKTNLSISSENSFFDKNSQIIEITNNVKLENFLNNFTLNSEKIVYDKSISTIKSIDETKIIYNNKFEINSKNIIYNEINNVFSSTEKTIIYDDDKNKFLLSNFSFDLNKNHFKGKQIKLIDVKNNSLELSNGYLNLNTNELIGSDFIFNFEKTLFGNPDNDPRLIGRYIITNKSETKMKKSKFTTCKNIPGKCPAWSISANEVSHKKDKKRIEYKNAWLEIYDVPVAYFPYFFHPDPTVKRQSGFLFPQFINNSNLGFSTQIPYFKAISHDKDMTISPRVFTDNNLFLQTEYRQSFENSNLITDLSFNKKQNTNSHLFSRFNSESDDSFFEMKIETASNTNYLKKYQIQSPLINSYSTLNSSFLFEKYTDNYYFSTSFDVIEDLSKEKNDRYEYIIPNYNFSKEIILNDSFFETANIQSTGNYKKFNTNVDEADMINDLFLISKKQNKLNNFDSEFSILFRNINTYGDLSTKYKDDENYNLISSALLNLRYPLVKIKENSNNFLNPMVSIRYSPNSGINLKNDETLIGFNDLFSFDRINNKTVEKDAALTLGIEYKNLNKKNNEKFKFGIGANFRDTNDEDLPLSSSLGQKTSDLIGYSGINITENLSFDYNFSIDENLSETNYSLVSANYISDKFKTTFEYMEKSNHIGDDSYLNNTTELQFDKSKSLAFETNRNIDKDLTNY